MFFSNLNLATFSRLHLAIWLSLAFQAGAINAGGFLACHRFVTHTTGFATFFGADVAKGDFLAAAGMLTVPMFFLLGAMISAFFVDRRQTLGKKPRYLFLMAFISLTMLFVAILGHWNYFGPFGSPQNITTDFTLLALLCLASGIQNASITSASGSVVRTTHLTGITTDLGIGLVRVLWKGPSHRIQSHEEKANWLRFGIIISFILGSTMGSFLFLHLQYLGFLVPSFISFLIFVILWRKQKESHP